MQYLLILLAFRTHLRVLASSFLRFRDHTRHNTVGRTPLNEWSARSRDLYLTNTQHSQQTNIHVLGGTRTRNPSKRVAADPRLRPLGHWDRQTKMDMGIQSMSKAEFEAAILLLKYLQIYGFQNKITVKASQLERNILLQRQFNMFRPGTSPWDSPKICEDVQSFGVSWDLDRLQFFVFITCNVKG